MQTKSIEREVKLEVELSFELPDLRGEVRTIRQPGQDLRAEYFDTSDYRLWQRGITFRHRTGEAGVGKWTVKLPTDTEGTTLDRTEISWTGTRDAFPDGATDLLRGVVGRSVLHQVAELVTTRRRLTLCHADGRPWGELADDTVSVIGGHRDGFRFRQLELELEGSETADVADLVLHELTQAGAQRDNEPKLAKALGLEPPPRKDGSAIGIGPKSSSGDLVRASIAGALDRLLDHDYRLRLDPANPDPHAVHQARVATRRLRSDLKTFGPLLDPVWSGHTRSELKWLGTVLGRVRDADVLSDRLTQDQAGGPTDLEGLDELQARLQSQRSAARQELATALAVGDRYIDLLERLHTAARTPPCYDGSLSAKAAGRATSPGDLGAAVLPRLVGRHWRAVRKKVRNAGSRPSDRQLHRIRIGAKQLRYASELAAPVIGKAARRTAKAAEELQTVLGEHHDAVTAEEWLRSEALTATPIAAFAAGRLAADRQRHQERLRRRWRKAWDELDRKDRRRWLH